MRRRSAAAGRRPASSRPMRTLLVMAAAATALQTPAFLVACTAPPRISGAVGERSEAMALAWGLLKENQDVAGILAIKSVSDDTETLVREIAAAGRQAAVTLEGVARREGLPLDDDGLPAAERRVRASIRARMTRELLLGSGAAFERSLLLSQIEALGYASNLLEEVAAQLRTVDLDDAAVDLDGEAKRFSALRVRAIGRLRIEGG